MVGIMTHIRYDSNINHVHTDFSYWALTTSVHRAMHYATTDNWQGECINHDDVIKWKHFPRYWPFVRRIHRSPVNSPRKGQWGEALMFSFICAWINGWLDNREAGDLRRHRAHYDIIAMCSAIVLQIERSRTCVIVNFGWNKRIDGLK